MPTIAAVPDFAISIGLFLIFATVLILPFISKKVEENLEFFFLVMGVLAVTISGLWSSHLVLEALKAPVIIGGVPVGIFQVVLVAGLLLYFFSKPFYAAISKLIRSMNTRLFVFLFIFVLGLLCSLISVIVTAVILAEVLMACPYYKADKIKLTVITCFAVGLGAVLTPVGEPLSTILVSKLSGAPYHAGFFWPLEIFGIYVIPGVLAVAAFGTYYLRNLAICETEVGNVYSESLKAVILRAVRVYAFIAALVLLGEGLSPLIIWYFSKINYFLLYWINSVSAILDNATLTAMEIGPNLSLAQIKAITLGLLIAGGMLVPGNIPNIVAAGRIGISMKQWAKIGLPVGAVLMAVYFIVIIISP